MSQKRLVFHTPISRDVPKLPRAVYAASKVAPSLCVVVRKLLEEQQATNEAIKDFLERNKSISRYESAFKLLWGILKVSGIDPLKASLMQVASALFNDMGSPRHKQETHTVP